MAGTSVRGLPRRFGFLLLQDFTLISLSSAVEPLRMANRIRGEQLYSWTIITETGEPMVASDGLSIGADHAINDERLLESLDLLIVCTGRRVEDAYTRPVERWLKLAKQKGVALGAICTGSYVLARAGLLDGYRCSIHWENLSALEDKHDRVSVSRNVFTIDRDRYTSSGGTTPVDMMLHIIREECGVLISAGVAEQFIYERVRRIDDKQRIPLKHLLGNASSKLVMAVELMESNIREPISQEELAAYVGLSRRQLQRLFQRHLDCAPSRYYLQLRLQRARELLQQTDLSLIEISSMCGFISTSHFSQCYKEHYSHSPSIERQRKIATGK